MKAPWHDTEFILFVHNQLILHVVEIYNTKGSSFKLSYRRICMFVFPNVYTLACRHGHILYTDVDVEQHVKTVPQNNLL